MTGTFWNSKIETATRENLRKHQLRLLKEKVKFCYESTSFYRAKFRAAGISPSDINTLDDLEKIPFTVKNDLRDNYPLGMLAVPLDDVVEIHASSGTTGNPIIGPYNAGDMAVWTELMARTLYTGGVRKADVIHIAYGYGLFTGGLGFHYGAQKIGSAIVPVSGGMTQRQIKLMKDLAATILCCTPSFALYLAEAMAKENIDPRKDLKLRLGFFGAEPWSERIRERIEASLGVEAFDIYGLTELCGPGVSVECSEHNGLHIWEDHFLIETIDPNTGETLEAGEEGELVFTALSKSALPIIRYRTRDISVIETEKCACGRTHSRMMRIRGRSDDMMIIRGVNVFPSQIEYVVMGFPELAPQYQIIVDRPETMDIFTIKAELAAGASGKTEAELDQLRRQIAHKVQNVTGLTPILDLVDPGSLPRTEGKAKRVLDLRSGKI